MSRKSKREYEEKQKIEQWKRIQAAAQRICDMGYGHIKIVPDRSTESGEKLYNQLFGGVDDAKESK